MIVAPLLASILLISSANAFSVVSSVRSSKQTSAASSLFLRRSQEVRALNGRVSLAMMSDALSQVDREYLYIFLKDVSTEFFCKIFNIDDLLVN